MMAEGSLRRVLEKKTEEWKTIVVFVHGEGWNSIWDEAIALPLDTRPKKKATISKGRIVFGLKVNGPNNVQTNGAWINFLRWQTPPFWIQNNTLAPNPQWGYLSFKNIFHQDGSRCILIAKPPIKIKWEHSYSRTRRKADWETDWELE